MIEGILHENGPAGPDLVVTPPEAILKTRVLLSVMDGRIVYRDASY